MYGFDFGEPQRVETREGTAYVREAAPTEQFWRAWCDSPRLVDS